MFPIFVCGRLVLRPCCEKVTAFLAAEMAGDSVIFLERLEAGTTRCSALRYRLDHKELRYFFDYPLERFRILLRDFRKHFPVKLDILFLQRTDERAVILETVLTECRIDAHYRKPAHRTLLGSAVAEGVPARVSKGLNRSALFFRAREAVALGCAQYIPAAFSVFYSSFGSCHKKLVNSTEWTVHSDN